MMSRWLFVLLLLANLVLVVFSAIRPESQSTKPTGAINRISSESGAKSISLLGEGVADHRYNEKTKPAENADGEPGCFLVGPLATISLAENYADMMMADGFTVEQRWRELTVGADYWVYLPQLPSARATTRTLQELKASDLEAFIFADGELKGAIALGAFTDEKSAESKRREFGKLGYEAKFHKMDRHAREYWLLSEIIPEQTELEDLTKSFGIEEIPRKISRMNCETVASAMQFQ